jgi:hypothetical protein
MYLKIEDVVRKTFGSRSLVHIKSRRRKTSGVILAWSKIVIEYGTICL